MRKRAASPNVEAILKVHYPAVAARILGVLVFNGPMVQRDLCERLALSESKVAAGAVYLQRAGLVVAERVTTHEPGRPPNLLRLSRDAPRELAALLYPLRRAMADLDDALKRVQT